MTRARVNPERLFDRPWRPGHPFHPRLGRGRRWSMTLAFCFMLLLISGYIFLTDSDRVRGMAEVYLTRVLGGPVQVRRATLSLFEGLKLSDVQVRVDEQGGPDSVIFSAQWFIIKYNPHALLTGRIDATQIIAIDPHVRLVENLDSGRWNYQRMASELRPATTVSTPRQRTPMTLPEILLRNAQIDYSEIKGGVQRSLGTMALEGRLSPVGDGRYSFDLQSRGGEGVGPALSGSLSLGTGQVSARLRNFEFGRDIRGMLPSQVRTWWEQHELAGSVDLPELTYQPAAGGGRATFRVVTQLNGVTLRVSPLGWMSSGEIRRLTAKQEAWRMLSALGPPGRYEPPARLLQPTATRLEKVAGTFIFTEDGIEIRDVSGRVETNGLRIDGRIDGYSPDAPGSLTLRSLDSENVFIPPVPRYVHALPDDIREIYDHLKPNGTCSLRVAVRRETAGGKVRTEGEVRVLDGNFVFDEFPYPLRQATGQIVFGADPTTGMDYLEIRDLRGLGVAGGPNRNSVVSIHGLVAPLGPEAGFTIRVRGQDVHSEPTLRDAFPPDVREALSIFGPLPSAPTHDHGGYPRFHGSFVCDMVRPIGMHKKWSISTDVSLDDASGALKAFPYPLDHVAVDLKVRDGYLDIINARMQRGDASLRIDGRVSFGKNRPVSPDLTLTARNVPIDKDLLEALPADRRAWLTRAGIGGRLDVDGKITLADAPGKSDQLHYDLKMKLREGTVGAHEGVFALAGVEGELRLTPSRLELLDLRGRRDSAPVTLSGAVEWPDDRPRATLRTTADNLTLDAALYRLLPAAARDAWDQVRPEGALDAQLTFTGGLDADDSADNQYELLLRPRKLSVNLRALPYRLDELTGMVRIAPRRVQLEEILARHGEATVAVSGTGVLGERSAWDLRLTGRDVAVDDALIRALPEGLSNLFSGLKVADKLTFDFSKLQLDFPPEMPKSAASSMPASAPFPAANARFDARVWLTDTDLDVGVPLKDVRGQLQLAGSVRDGNLADLRGEASVQSLLLSGRSVRDFHARMHKSAGQNVLKIADMNAAVAGGSMAGDVQLYFSDSAPSRYALGLVLRDADVRELSGETDRPIEGRLSASLNLEGEWSRPSVRRGRGDVQVAGREMYRIPLVLGLLQITNLTLPISGPFNEGTARYSVEGKKVTFEQIELRASNLLMQGSGSLDFDSKKVRMSFVTDTPGGLKLPFVHDLWQGVRHELLQIQVRGSIEEPKVSARSMGTLQTTIDEVFKGGR